MARYNKAHMLGALVFLSMLLRCFRAVRSLMPRHRATSLSLRPCAISSSMSRSRADNGESSGLKPAWPGRRHGEVMKHQHRGLTGLQFSEQVLPVLARGRESHRKPGGNLLVGEPLCDQRQDSDFLDCQTHFHSLEVRAAHWVGPASQSLGTANGLSNHALSQRDPYRICRMVS